MEKSLNSEIDIALTNYMGKLICNIYIVYWYIIQQIKYEDFTDFLKSTL